MKTIKLKEKQSSIEYLKKEYDFLPRQTCIFCDQSIDEKNDFSVSYLYKDILCKEDSWKFIMLALCSIVGLLDRNRIKAMIKWPNIVYVHDKEIARVSIDIIEDQEFKGIILTIYLNMNQSDKNICMKDVTKRTYKKNILVTGLTTFLNIYDNLYHTNQFDKVLDYANDISYLKDKKVKYLNYGAVSFIKLNRDGILSFVDEKGMNHQQYINEIREI